MHMVFPLVPLSRVEPFSLRWANSLLEGSRSSQDGSFSLAKLDFISIGSVVYCALFRTSGVLYLEKNM